MTTLITIDKVTRVIVQVEDELTLEQLKHQPIELVKHLGPHVGVAVISEQVTEVTHQ